MKKRVRYPLTLINPPPPRIQAGTIVPSVTVVEHADILTDVNGYHTNSIQFTWTVSDEQIPKLYVKYRLRDNNGPGMSIWSVPRELTGTFYNVYRRPVSTSGNEPNVPPEPWDLFTVVVGEDTGQLITRWEEQVQYCVALSHPNAQPQAEEGVKYRAQAMTPIVNPYVLFCSAEYATHT